MNAWYESNTGNHQGLVIEEETGRNVAVTYDKADASIIAAAPDLLAALQALWTEFQSRTALVESCDLTPAEERALDMAEAAIAKAKG